ECATRTCAFGVCGVAFNPAGTPLVSEVPGDCKRGVCDGAGNAANVIDDTDVPSNGNQCTTALCSGGTPLFAPAPVGTSCSQNGGLMCNGVGSCVQCVESTQCPGVDTACATRTCTANVCGFSFAASGTSTMPQTAGDCQVQVCDGAGNVVGV